MEGCQPAWKAGWLAGWLALWLGWSGLGSHLSTARLSRISGSTASSNTCGEGLAPGRVRASFQASCCS
eukprot:4325058-Heterocapsa_arctica.AAC.1